MSRSTKETLRILKEVDERERKKGTLAIGVKWDFGQVDLEEIVTVSWEGFEGKWLVEDKVTDFLCSSCLQCLGGKSLAVICRMFCEEYGHRASGVPDLM